MARKYLLMIAIFVLGFGAPLLAQTPSGTVNGRVVDSSGLPVPGTNVTLVNPATGVKLSTQTNNDGYYSFPFVHPGSYRLAAQKTGFKEYVAEFQLAVNQTVRVDAPLTIGTITQRVTVAAKSTLLDTETSGIGQVINSQQVADLPLNGRNAFALAGLVPGIWTGPVFGEGLSQNRMAALMAGANNFTADGGITGNNAMLLDGVPITVCCQGQPALVPSVDLVQEFKVQTNSSGADFGRTSGGTFNVVSKYGTNKFHGSAYEFFQNEQLNAASFFENRSGIPPIPGRNDLRPPLRYNQFGFTVGGPLIIPKLYKGRSKTFIFGGWEGAYVRKYAYHVGTTPPAAIRNGDFSSAPDSVYDPLTTTADPNNPGQYLRTAFQGNQIPSDRISPIAKNYLQYFPEPNAPGIVDNYSWLDRDPENNGQGTIRVDHNISNSSRIFARWSISSDTYHLGDWPNGITAQAQLVDAQTFVLAYTKTLSPSVVLNLRAGMAWQTNDVRPASIGLSATTLGYPASFASQQSVTALPKIGISGFNGIGNDSYVNTSRPTSVLSPSIIWAHGAHSIQFGWDGRLIRDNEGQLSGGAGAFGFNSTFTRGPNPFLGVSGAQNSYDSFASFLLGFPSNGSITYRDSFARQQYYNALYFKDDWHVTQKLTVNLGGRVDFDAGFTERYNRQTLFNPTLSTPLAQETGLPIQGGIVFTGVNGAPRQLWKPSTLWAPRVGLAYALNNKTVLRGAYGIFYLPTSQRGFLVNYPGFVVSTPFVATIDGVTPVDSLANPFPNGTIPLAGSSLGPLTLVGSHASAMLYNTSDGYNQQWNFNIQRQLPGKIFLSVAYAGSHSLKLPQFLSPNSLQPRYYGTPGDLNHVAYLTELVPNPFYGIITTGPLAGSEVQRQQLLAAYPQYTGVTEQLLGGAYATYNALQIMVHKRYSDGLSFLMAYTWSKNLGDANDYTTGFLGTGTPGYQNSWNLSIEKSVLSTDIPHRFVLSGSYEFPLGKGKRFGSAMSPWLNAIAGGWQANAIATVQSGYPLAFSVSGTPAFGGARPNFTGLHVQPYTSGSITDRLGGASGGSGYLNASAFSKPLSFQFGNVPRLTGGIRGPGYRNLDLSIMKNFTIREGLTMQFRAAAFNLPNQVIFSNPVATVGSAAFGRVSGQVNSPRTIQLALKLLW